MESLCSGRSRVNRYAPVNQVNNSQPGVDSARMACPINAGRKLRQSFVVASNEASLKATFNGHPHPRLPQEVLAKKTGDQEAHAEDHSGADEQSPCGQPHRKERARHSDDGLHAIVPAMGMARNRLRANSTRCSSSVRGRVLGILVSFFTSVGSRWLPGLDEAHKAGHEL